MRFDAIGTVPGIESRYKRLVMTRAETGERVGIVEEAVNGIAEWNLSALA
ncbi:hypothetical protein [Burkholderia seminalis]|nr:hypothetical protein [Burkholderia seminalis]MBJ9969134.1 hypothetical protein [Burkholderia seminalis]